MGADFYIANFPKYMIYYGSDPARKAPVQKGDNFMFSNIGKKLQTLAWIAFILGCIASIILAFTLVRNSLDLGILASGCLISWIGSWSLYAFGQITEDIHAMRQENRIATHLLLYSQAKQLIIQQQYQQASVILEDIVGFRDAEKLLHHCLCTLATAQIEAGEYKDACLTLKKIKGDPTADALISEARYLRAKERLAQGKKEDAYKLLKKILSYKDVQQIIQSDPELSAMHKA